MAHKALQKVNHRPWTIPERPWRMKQTWKNLLFMHWPVPRNMLEPHIPEKLKLQEYNGNAWIGIVPFEMDNLAIRPLPPFPGLSAFPELNLRTYVEYKGKPGVLFLSLDASSSIAVWAARTFFNLPYHSADMSFKCRGSVIQFDSKRDTELSPISFKASYRPIAEPQFAKKGSLEHWLTERYCLYTQSPDNVLYRTEIHHLPWKLQQAQVNIEENQLCNPFNIRLPDMEPRLHFSKNIEVIVWTQEKLKSN